MYGFRKTHCGNVSLTCVFNCNRYNLVPMREKAIVAPTVPAPMMATREAVGVGIAMLE
jgi:hypothetical protein